MCAALKTLDIKKTKKRHRTSIADDLAYIFQLDNNEDSKKVLYGRAQAVSQKWIKYYPNLVCLADSDFLSYYTTYLEFEYEIRNMIYTTNWIERLNKSFIQAYLKNPELDAEC